MASSILEQKPSTYLRFMEDFDLHRAYREDQVKRLFKVGDRNYFQLGLHIGRWIQEARIARISKKPQSLHVCPETTGQDARSLAKQFLPRFPRGFCQDQTRGYGQLQVWPVS